MPKFKHPEDVFYIGVPVDARDYDRCAASLARRAARIEGHITTPTTLRNEREKKFVGALAANVVAWIPSCFHYEPPQTTGVQLASYLAHHWEQSALAALLQRDAGAETRERADLLLSEIWASDKEEFRRRAHKRSMRLQKKGRIAKAADTADHLYHYLYEKADWQERKNAQTPSYDRELRTPDEEGQPVYYRDKLGEYPTEMLGEIDRKMDLKEIKRYARKLPPAEKSAVAEFSRGKPQNPTTRKAKNRGIDKIQKWIGEEKH